MFVHRGGAQRGAQAPRKAPWHFCGRACARSSLCSWPSISANSWPAIKYVLRGRARDAWIAGSGRGARAAGRRECGRRSFRARRIGADDRGRVDGGEEADGAGVNFASGNHRRLPRVGADPSKPAAAPTAPPSCRRRFNAIARAAGGRRSHVFTALSLRAQDFLGLCGGAAPLST